MPHGQDPVEDAGCHKIIKSLIMSNQENDGECQLEVDFVDEGDLEGRFKSCPKNPGHKNFLSLESLKLKDLPEHHRTRCALDFIYHVAQFTVRLVVEFISPDRPCQCGQENTSQDRQCICLRGNVRNVGSGLVTGLAGPDQLTPDVRDSTKTYFILVTAAHVIFDTSEAQKTEIEFFYDDPHDRSSVRKAFGLRVLNINLEADFSEVLGVTEDDVIAGKLKNRKFYRTISDEIERSYPSLHRKSSLKENDIVSQDFAFHISHPHGTSKKVTLGNIVSADTRHGHYQLIYNVATCRGSSGGPVFVFPGDVYDTNDAFENLESIVSVPHARHHGNELNSSSSWTVYFSDNNKMMDKPKSSVEDTTLDQQNIVRLSLLDIEDFPLESRSYYNLYYIKYLSKFTVGIHVLNNAKFDSKSMASGFVIRLANNDDIKPDLEDTTKTYFIMVTAAHVISDTSQAKEAEINFFCDDLQDMSSVRKAFGLRVLNSNMEFNFSEVLCVTKDQVIISMLKENCFKQPRMITQYFFKELTSKMQKSLTDSFFLSEVSRDCFTIKNENKERLLFEVYMNLKSNLERLVLLTLFKDIDSFASDIFLRIFEEYYSSRSVTSQSDVLDYVTFLDKYLTDNPVMKEKCLWGYSINNKEKLIVWINYISSRLYCEIMRPERHKITFQVSHHGIKEISFDMSCVRKRYEMMGKYRWDAHDDSPVFTTLCRPRVLSKDDTVEPKLSGISLRLQQYCIDLSNETLQTDDGTTISFPR